MNKDIGKSSVDAQKKAFLTVANKAKFGPSGIVIDEAMDEKRAAFSSAALRSSGKAVRGAAPDPLVGLGLVKKWTIMAQVPSGVSWWWASTDLAERAAFDRAHARLGAAGQGRTSQAKLTALQAAADSTPNPAVFIRERIGLESAWAFMLGPVVKPWLYTYSDSVGSEFRGKFLDQFWDDWSGRFDPRCWYTNHRLYAMSAQSDAAIDAKVAEAFRAMDNGAPFDDAAKVVCFSISQESLAARSQPRIAYSIALACRIALEFERYVLECARAIQVKYPSFYTVMPNDLKQAASSVYSPIRGIDPGGGTGGGGTDDRAGGSAGGGTNIGPPDEILDWQDMFGGGVEEDSAWERYNPLALVESLWVYVEDSLFGEGEPPPPPPTQDPEVAKKNFIAKVNQQKAEGEESVASGVLSTAKVALVGAVVVAITLIISIAYIAPVAIPAIGGVIKTGVEGLGMLAKTVGDVTVSTLATGKDAIAGLL